MSKATEIPIGLQVTILGFVLFVIIFGGGIWLGNVTRPEPVKYVMDPENHCELISKRKTGERLHCGKACTTDEYRHVFECPKRGKMLIDYYEIK